MTQNARVALWVPTTADANPGEIIEIRSTAAIGQVIKTEFQPQEGAEGGISDAPADDLFYARRNSDWEISVGEAPSDGQYWARKDESWQLSPPFPEAPLTGLQYARSMASWIEISGMPPVIDGGTF